jgi:hypothetical protein
VIAIKQILKQMGGMKARQSIFSRIIKKVLAAPINLYYDVTSVGAVSGKVNDIQRLGHIQWFLDWVNGMVLDIF